jgi:hypothetical protein
VSMAATTILMLATLAALVGLPGWLVYRLSGGRLSWREGAALAAAGLSVLFSDVGAVFGYRLPLMLGINLAAAAGLGVAAWVRARRLRKEPHAGQNGAAPPRIDWLSLLYSLLAFGVFLAPAFVMYLPYDTDAQGFGYLALMVREGGTVDTLAPWQPDVHYLYSPAFFIWSAYLSDLLGLPLHQVMLPFAHIAAGLVALLGLDLGRALAPERPRVGWLMSLVLLGGLGLFTTVMDSAYTTVLGLLFMMLFLALVFRGEWLAAVALAAVPLTHPDTIIILLLGYIPFYATFWLSRESGGWGAWTRRFVWIPGMALALTLPWLVRVWPLFLHHEIASPFPLSLTHVQQLVVFNGVLPPLLALVGVVVAIRRRRPGDILMVTWLLFILDFSLFGLSDRLAGLAGVDLMRYVYPFSVAWHGPIVPYAYLVAVALDAALRRVALPRRTAFGLLAGGIVTLALAAALSGALLRASKPLLPIFGAFSSEDDLAAMAYLREHAPEDALILNYPLGYEGHWVPTLAERESVAFRERENPFFAGSDPYYERVLALTPVYFDLAAPGAQEALARYGVTYVVVPQIVTEPERFAEMQRWRWPGETWYPLASSPAEVTWLELVFERNGAQVYRVIAP